MHISCGHSIFSSQGGVQALDLGTLLEYWEPCDYPIAPSLGVPTTVLHSRVAVDRHQYLVWYDPAELVDPPPPQPY